jgi:cold shock CspA family protein
MVLAALIRAFATPLINDRRERYVRHFDDPLMLSCPFIPAGVQCDIAPPARRFGLKPETMKTLERNMTGTITRLVDNDQVGSIAGEDGVEYVFTDGALRGTTFQQLSLGAAVTFTPASSSRKPRAEFVRLAR